LCSANGNRPVVSITFRVLALTGGKLTASLSLRADPASESERDIDGFTINFPFCLYLLNSTVLQQFQFCNCKLLLRTSAHQQKHFELVLIGRSPALLVQVACQGFPDSFK
jgi:hypothetical protein